MYILYLSIFHTIWIHAAFVVTKSLQSFTTHGEYKHQTNSFNTIKCTILQSYKHSKSPTYTGYSSV